MQVPVIMAGFSLDEPYYIPRSEIKPPPALTCTIFPWADAAFQEILSKGGENKDIAAKCFLKLILEMRSIILQVSHLLLLLLLYIFNFYISVGCCIPDGRISRPPSVAS